MPAAPHLSTPADAWATTPADGERPGGRFVIHGRTSEWRNGGTVSDGLARLLDAIARQMPREEVDAVWVFPGVRREGREYGVAVVSRWAGEDRRRVYRARYVVHLKGQERGKTVLELDETAETPAALVPEVIEGVRRRADEAGEAELVDLTAWKRGDGDTDRPG